jgi:hypothetical protein
MAVFQWMLLSLLPCLARGICDCGFSALNPDNPEELFIFTDMIETDFTLGDEAFNSQEWVRQEFNVSAKTGRGKYGKVFVPTNVKSHSERRGEDGLFQGEEALGLRVGELPQDDNAVPAAELDSARLDLHWGSYRAALKATSVNGTCAAFFWVSQLLLGFLGLGQPAEVS